MTRPTFSDVCQDCLQQLVISRSVTQIPGSVMFGKVAVPPYFDLVVALRGISADVSTTRHVHDLVIKRHIMAQTPKSDCLEPE